MREFDRSLFTDRNLVIIIRKNSRCLRLSNIDSFRMVQRKMINFRRYKKAQIGNKSKFNGTFFD